MEILQGKSVVFGEKLIKPGNKLRIIYLKYTKIWKKPMGNEWGIIFSAHGRSEKGLFAEIEKASESKIYKMKTASTNANVI